MANDQELIYESYKKGMVISEMGLGAAAIGTGLEAPIQTNIALEHKPSDYNPSEECACKHGKPCNECEECGCELEECEEYPEDESQQYTDIAKQQLYRIHRIAEDLHEMIDHHAFRPWMSTKITEALSDLSHIYDRVDYDVSVKSHSESPKSV
jgi:hypothetical protein